MEPPQLTLGDTVAQNSMRDDVETQLVKPAASEAPETLEVVQHEYFFSKLDVTPLRRGYTAYFLMKLRYKILMYIFFMALIQGAFYGFVLVLLKGRMSTAIHYAMRAWFAVFLQTIFLIPLCNFVMALCLTCKPTLALSLDWNRRAIAIY